MLKYKKIIRYILTNIEQNKYKMKKPLPTIRELSQIFSCSKSTVMKAYSELQQEKIVYGIPKSGYFLVNRTIDNTFSRDDINFSMAIPDRRIFPYQDFQNCLSEATIKYKNILFKYNNEQGLFELRSLLVKQLQEYQVFCSIDNLAVTNGAQQAIHILCNLDFGNNKKNILVEEPTYAGILKILKWEKIKAYTIRRTFEGIDLEQLEYIFKNKEIKFFYTTTRFHNPLGNSLSLQQRRKISYLAKKYDVYIVEDDYLAELYVRNDVPLYYEDEFKHTIYIKSFSKIILPELRLAAVVLPDCLINTFNEYKHNIDLGTSLLLQGALEIYLSSGMFEMHKKKSRKIYKDKMKRIKEYSLKYDFKNCEWYIPKTGYFFCLKLVKDINIESLIKNMYKKNIILGNINDNFLSKNINNSDTLKLCISSLTEDEVKDGLDNILKEIN